MAQYRQGDVLLTRVDEAVLDECTVLDREDGRVTLALGEKSGHAHVIVDEGAAEWRGRNGERYLFLAFGCRHIARPEVHIYEGVWPKRPSACAIDRCDCPEFLGPTFGDDLIAEYQRLDGVRAHG